MNPAQFQSYFSPSKKMAEVFDLGEKHWQQGIIAMGANANTA